MEAGEFEGATIKVILRRVSSTNDTNNPSQWLQTKQQAEIFDHFFVKLDPNYTRQCSSLVNLSVAAAVTSSLANHLAQKLNWLDTILSSIDYSVRQSDPLSLRLLT
jgi:hypothetical protein